MEFLGTVFDFLTWVRLWTLWNYPLVVACGFGLIVLASLTGIAIEKIRSK